MRSTGTTRRRPARRQRFTPFALLVGLLASAVSTAGVGVTYSTLTASVTNTADTAGAGTLVMQETDASGGTANACSSRTDGDGVVTCSRFDKYGGPALRPGATAAAVTVRVYSTGDVVPGSFSLAPGSCAVQQNPVGGSGDVCSALGVTATCTRYTAGVAGTPVDVFTSGATLASIAGGSIDLVAKGCLPQRGAIGSDTYSAFRFTVSMKEAAGIEVQGQQAAQTLAWRFTAGA